MSKDYPDYQDADLILRLYEMRREPLMRESRRALIAGYAPLTLEDCLAIAAPDHPLNAAYRQVASYWEMAYGMIKHGIVHGDYMMESNGEGMVLFTRVEPWLPQLRDKTGPFAFANAEWVATHCERGKGLAARFRARHQAAMAAASSK